MVKYTHNLTTHHSVMILFCFLHRHEKRRPRDLSHHPPRETSHDVQRHTQQGNPASLQEVHARRKYNHPLLSGPRASSPLHSRSFVPALKCRYRRFLSGCHGRLVWLGHRTLSTGKIDGALWRRLQSVQTSGEWKAWGRLANGNEEWKNTMRFSFGSSIKATLLQSIWMNAHRQRHFYRNLQTSFLSEYNFPLA